MEKQTWFKRDKQTYTKSHFNASTARRSVYWQRRALFPWNFVMDQLQREDDKPVTDIVQVEVIEAWQFERGLVHISDQCFLVFMHMEQLQVDLMNSMAMQKFK